MKQIHSILIPCKAFELCTNHMCTSNTHVDDNKRQTSFSPLSLGASLLSSVPLCLPSVLSSFLSSFVSGDGDGTDFSSLTLLIEGAGDGAAELELLLPPFSALMSGSSVGLSPGILY